MKIVYDNEDKQEVAQHAQPHKPWVNLHTSGILSAVPGGTLATWFVIVSVVLPFWSNKGKENENGW